MIVIFTGPVFHVSSYPGISGEHWGFCIGIAALTFPVNLILKYIPDPCIKQEGNINDLQGKSITNKGSIASLRESKTFAKQKQISKNLSRKHISNRTIKREESKKVHNYADRSGFNSEQQGLHNLDEKSAQL